MNSVPSKPQTLARACLFELENVLFAVPGQYTRQIHTLENFTRVPRAPQDLLGLFAVRGQIFPLVRIEPILGLNANTSEAKLAVQIEFEGKHMVFVIDVVVGFDYVPPKLEPVLDGRFSALMLGQVVVAGRVANVLDVAKVVQSLAARIDGRELAQA
jgi:chemotaxis signal transduction protein